MLSFSEQMRRVSGLSQFPGEAKQVQYFAVCTYVCALMTHKQLLNPLASLNWRNWDPQGPEIPINFSQTEQKRDVSLEVCWRAYFITSLSFNRQFSHKTLTHRGRFTSFTDRSMLSSLHPLARSEAVLLWVQKSWILLNTFQSIFLLTSMSVSW